MADQVELHHISIVVTFSIIPIVGVILCMFVLGVSSSIFLRAIFFLAFYLGARQII